MMHERGKSDTVIVAVKPANVAERSGAERAEQRAVTEGNVDQQPTCRTQSRAAAKTAQGDVSQELARIRRVASRNGEERFTALLHHVSTGLLDLRKGTAKPAGSANRRPSTSWVSLSSAANPETAR